MSQARRHELRGGSDIAVTDDTNVFKKNEQAIGRPPVVDNINDEYARRPPNNQPFEPNTERRSFGQKEGAYDRDASTESVNDEQLLYMKGKYTKSEALEDVVNDKTVHPNNPVEEVLE